MWSATCYRCADAVPGPVTKLLIIGDERSSHRSSWPSVLGHNKMRRWVRWSRLTWKYFLSVFQRAGHESALSSSRCPVGEVVAIGDAPNDLDMLVMAGSGIAVANAHDAVISAADYVAPSCDEGAIARRDPASSLLSPH